jgi:hypothetical protein
MALGTNSAHLEDSPMKKTPTQSEPRSHPRPRDRSNTVVIDLGRLRSILDQLADQDARPLGESPNMSRTVRRLIAEEAQRRGITMNL